MPRLVLDIDDETLDRLLDAALRERRPLPWQGEVVLRRALGLPVPDERAAARPGRHADEQEAADHARAVA